MMDAGRESKWVEAAARVRHDHQAIPATPRDRFLVVARATSCVTALARSLLKAARSVAERNRIAAPSDKVASRLPVSFDRRRKALTSRIMRAAKAMTMTSITIMDPFCH